MIRGDWYVKAIYEEEDWHCILSKIFLGWAGFESKPKRFRRKLSMNWAIQASSSLYSSVHRELVSDSFCPRFKSRSTQKCQSKLEKLEEAEERELYKNKIYASFNQNNSMDYWSKRTQITGNKGGNLIWMLKWKWICK